LGIHRAGPTVRWFNAETGEPLATSSEGHRQVVLGIAFSSDGARAASAADDGTVAIWEPASLQLITTFKGHMHSAWVVAFSPDNRRLATGGGHRDAVKLWDLSTHREVLNLPGKSFHFALVTFSPDGRWLAACPAVEGQLHLWYAPSWEEIEAAENRPDDGRQGPVEKGALSR
jgi:WD40 repeat protein